MADPSAAYQGNTPNLESGGLTPLQLALARYMITQGDNQPFGINQAFLDEATTFADPEWLNPLNVDYKTGTIKEPDLIRNIQGGISFIARGEDIYLLRRAEDCGPDEDRTELVFLGVRPDIADGTFAFYGFIRPGSFTSGAGGAEGGGGFGYSPPAVSFLDFAAIVGNPYSSAADVQAAVSQALGFSVSVTNSDPEGAQALAGLGQNNPNDPGNFGYGPA